MINFKMIWITILSVSCVSISTPKSIITSEKWMRLSASQPAPEILFCLNRSGAEQAHNAFLSCNNKADMSEEKLQEELSKNRRADVLVRYGFPIVGLTGLIIGCIIGIAATSK